MLRMMMDLWEARVMDDAMCPGHCVVRRGRRGQALRVFWELGRGYGRVRQGEAG